MEDEKIHFHKGPPFQKIAVQDEKPCESAHSKGIYCIRYTSDGALVASVAGDKSLCIYDGKELGLKTKLENIHTGTIYACAWASDKVDHSEVVHALWIKAVCVEDAPTVAK